MDPPGFSLFQGAESIHVDGLCNAAAEEEAEDLIDRKRRENELEKELQNAFDDLEEDDETMDNSYLHDVPQCRGETEDQDLSAIYRLRVELQSKTNELSHVNKLLTDERQASQRTIGDLKKQLALAVAEQQRAQMQKNQTHELLVESKTRLSELDAAMAKLRDQNQALEAEKGQVTVELENARMMANDAEMKCRMMQKEVGRAGSQNHSRDQQDTAFKQLAERHSAQLAVMQQQIDNFRDKLEAKDVELRTSEAKYRELQRTRESLMIEKTETINRMQEQLERAQRQCQDLLANQSLTKNSEAENALLRKKVEELELHIDGLQKTADGLLRQLDCRRSDFANVMESTPHMRRNAQPGLLSLEETDGLEREVANLRREVQEKETEIKNLIMTENELRQKLRCQELTPHPPGTQPQSRLNTTTGCSDCRVTMAQLMELKSLNEHLTESNTDLQRVNKRIVETQEKDNRLVVEKLHELKTLQGLISDQKRRIEALEKDKADLERDFSAERQKIREMSEHSLQCMENMRVATKIEVKNMQLQTDCMDYLKNLKGLRAASQIISETNGRSTSNFGTSTSPTSSNVKTYCDRSVMVSTPSDLCSVGSQTTESESSRSSTSASTFTEEKSAIIQEYAKLSAAEIKRVEEAFRGKLQEAQKDLDKAKRDLEEMRRICSEDTEVFKEVLLAEREEYENLLEVKEREVEALRAKFCALEQKGARTQREDELMESLEKELNKKQEEIDEERKSMALWRKQWKEERKQLMAIEEHLKKENEVLRENWKSAKSTATNYKKYTEEKDKFITREIERMRMQYEGVIEKLRLKCKRLGA